MRERAYSWNRRRKSAEIGRGIAVELIERLQEIEGVRGVHIQAIEWERAVPKIVKAAGLLPRPEIAEEAPTED